MITLPPHPLLDLRAFLTTWRAPLGEIRDAEWLVLLASLTAPIPLPVPDEASKAAVRDLLRQGGFSPSGRNKPCNEYIRDAAGKGLFPTINPAVDATNLAALHGGLPVSTVDPDKLRGDLRVDVAAPGDSYVFNASGQVITLSGLICLFDADGPCSNAVKDSQRAKTTPESTKTLTLVWGTLALPGRAEAVSRWHRELNERLGGVVSDVTLQRP